MSARSLVASALLACCACDAPPPDPAAHCPARDEVDCAVDLGGHLPARAEGSTLGGEDGYSGSRCGLGGGVAVEDAAFRWTAPRAGHYRFSTEGSSFDTTLSVRGGSCAGREVACNDDAAEGSTWSAVDLDLDECETVTVVVDGYDAEAVGAYVLAITASEAACSDGADDDADGLVDCADPDCFGPRCDVVNGEWPAAWTALERGVIDAVNRVRAEGTVCDGVPQPAVGPLERNAYLEEAARLHSLDMAEQRYLSHDSLDGRTVGDRVADAGFTGAGPVGENIAQGYETVEDVMAGWLSSPGHCLNIMNPSYHVIGVGYAVVEGGDGPRWTQNFGGGH